MNLEFHYSAAIPSVYGTNDALRVAVSNPACTENSEIWTIPAGESTTRGYFHCIESENYIVAAASVPVTPATLGARTETLYDQLLTDHPEFSLYRIWCFLPQINEKPDGELENYRAFCKGRAIAFEKHASEALQSKISAASAVGTNGAHLTLVYFAGKPQSTHIENPQQIPAYHYPEEYGPKPPLFARATSFSYNGKPALFISGTSSILASESIGHTIESQLATTIDNLEMMADKSPTLATNLRRVRVYLRHAKDFEYVQNELTAVYLNEGDVVHYIIADICRKELRVEIEVTIGL